MTTSAAASAPTDRRAEVRRNREMALGFGIGSVLFAAGAAGAALGATPRTSNMLFALGAVGFTLAALVQLIGAVAHFPPGPKPVRRSLTDPDLTSSVIQFVGTVAFNVMTLRAVLLPPTTADYGLVWRPDVIGSMCFLISSWIAWHPIVRARRHTLVPGRSLMILRANMAGSIFFAISAWGAELVGPDNLKSVFWNNVGTFVGALGFLVAAVLLWPPRKPSDE